MVNAEVEYQKLKGLVETLGRVGQAKDKLLLDEAEMNLKANSSNSEALSNLERNLRNVRVRILSDLTGIIKNFG